MKNLVFKYRILLIILILIFFLLVPMEKINAAAENYFFIGDSRTYHMITYYPNHSTSQWKYDTIGKFSGKIVNQSAIGKDYVGTKWDDWFGSKGALKSKLNALSSAPTGTKVIIWLGVNDMNNTSNGTPKEKADLYVKEVKKLANTYKNLMFCQVSVTAVYEPQAKSIYSSLLNNTRIDQFNDELKSKISGANMANYRYIDINSDLKSYITSNNPTVGDGLHYTNVYYRTISDKIYEKVSKINYTPDTTPPSLSSINVTSPAGGTYKAGTKITLVSTYSENIYGNASKATITSSTAPKLTVKFGTGDAKSATFSSVSGKTITYTYTIQAGDYGKLALATHTGTVYDAAGNKLSVGTKTIGGNSITADTIQPNCTIIANTKNTTNASSIIYTFTWSETLANNTFTVDDITVTNGTKGEFKIVTANKVYTLVVKNTGSCEQTVSVAANKCTDSCGNPNKLASKSVTIDRTAPTLEVTKNPTSWTKSDVTLTINAEDKESGINNVTVDGKKVTLSNGKYEYKVSNNGTYKVVATDNVGNKKEQSVTVSNIDKTAPTLEVTKNPTSWTKSDVTLIIKAGDTASKLKNVTVDGTAITLDSNGQGTYKVTKNGTYKVIATDTVGNTKEQSVTVSNIDKTGLTCEVEYSTTNPTNGNVKVIIKTNREVSAIDGWTLSKDKKELTKIYSSNKEEQITLKDSLENSATAKIKITNIDKTAPILEVTKNPTSWTKSDVILTIKAGDDESGVNNVTVDGKKVTSSNGKYEYKVTKNGTYKVVVTDRAENTKEQSVTVSNIDKTAPTLEVTKNPENLTKDDVTLTINVEDKESGVNNVTVDGKKVTLSNGKYEYKVSNNGTYKVVVTDKAGNTKEQSVTVSNIDKTGLTCEVEYSTTNPTNGNVKVTIKTNKEVSAIDGWTLSKDKKELTKTYSSNKEEQITLKDSLGNSATAKIKITNIDKIAPTLKVTKNPENLTKDDVTLTINAEDKESGINNVTVDGKKVTLSNGKYEYKVTKNGTYKVVVTDKAGNTKEQSVTVSNIDKTGLTCEVEYSTTNPTNGNVKVTIKANKEVSAIDGWTLSKDKKELTKTYSSNKEEQVTLQDSLGNSATAKIKITNIDKTAPTLEVTGNPTSWKKSDVTLTIKANDVGSGLNSVTVDGTVITLDENNQGTYKVTKNGIHTIVATDKVGNTKEQSVTVSNIDKTVSVINNVIKTPETWTSGGVTIKVEAEDKESGIKEYSFDGGNTWQTSNEKTYNKNTNGIIVKVKDKAGNIKEYSEEINITNIKDMTDVIEIKNYTIENNMLKGIQPGTTLNKFKENVIIKDATKVKILNKQNKEIVAGEKITTGSKVQINAFGETVEYKIVVSGDTTGDGQADFNDMMKVNLHRLNKIELEGEYFEAGDVNKDGKVDFTDFIKINLFRLSKIQSL